jgi:hypothetical protein
MVWYDEKRGEDIMRKTLREWEKLWRERWDRNDDADLDHLFAGTKDLQELICEVELTLYTQGGRIEVVRIALFDAEGDGKVLASYNYTMLEMGRVELVQDIIASINTDPEDEEAPLEGDQDLEEYRLG